MDSTSRIRVAIVGADPLGRYWGARAHLPAIQALEGYELVAVCTAHVETAEASARKYGVRHFYSDYQKLMENDEIDLVTVAVRVRSHYPISKAALESGKMVFCEWPLALNSSEAADLVRIAKRKRIPTVVGTQSRCSPGLMYLRELIQQGYVGKPLFFNLTHMLPKFPIQSDHSWPALSEEGNDVLYVATAHSIDYLRYCLDEPIAVIGTLETLMPEVKLSDTGSPFAWTAADTVKCQLKLSNGIEGTVIASHAAWSGGGFRLEVYGTDGRLVARAPGYISYSPVGVQGSRRSEPETDMPIPSRFYEVRNIDENSAGFTVSQLLNRFERSIRDRTIFHPDFSDGYRVHAVIETIRKSATTQRWEEIPHQGM